MQRVSIECGTLHHRTEDVLRKNFDCDSVVQMERNYRHLLLAMFLQATA